MTITWVNFWLKGFIKDFFIFYEIRCYSLPITDPQKNGDKGTPTKGPVRLINQFGKNGVIRKNKI